MICVLLAYIESAVVDKSLCLEKQAFIVDI